MNKKKQGVVIGAGPAGLTAALELLKTKLFKVRVLERDKVVGGLARTTNYKGYKFDIGPHHFVTDSSKIYRWWHRLMGDEFFKLKRFTRIYYKKHFFHYPLQAFDVLAGLKISECLRCVGSYLRARLFPIRNVRSFEDWVINKFGFRLYSIFFKTYTEKGWGIPCHKISADWVAERIKGFNMAKAIFYAFVGRWYKKNAPRTLSDTFYYPPHGAGMVWGRAADQVRGDKDGIIELDEEVVTIKHRYKKITSVHTTSTSRQDDSDYIEELHEHHGDYFFSTMPLKTFVLSMDPKPPAHVMAAAKCLGYRALISVNLVIDKPDLFPDHWLYIHEQDVRLARIGNMNNFSSTMVKNPRHTALSLEYFAFVDEPLWHASDNELIKLGKEELQRIGIVDAKYVIDAMVIRTPEAYPMYDEHYKNHRETVLSYLSSFSNLQLMGRNALHQYNNMDVAMLSAMESVNKVVLGEQKKISPKEVATLPFSRGDGSSREV